MPKLGKQFELVVADVVQALDPHCTVIPGEWVKGPDGRREIDVLVVGTSDGVARQIQIECKDYKGKGRPIGIAAIDALDSKHRDLGFDLSLLCCNLGFTDDAVNKAKRLGIGLIGVMRKGDQRIRYRVFDEIYSRRVDFVLGSADVTAQFVDMHVRPASIEECRYNGIPVVNWLEHRIGLFLAWNPVVRGRHQLKLDSRIPFYSLTVVALL